MLLSVPALVQAQADTGRVTGSVADASGAIIPGTVLILTNTDTGVAKTSTADASGNFNFSAVVRGNYKLEAKAEGFASVAQAFTIQVFQVQEVNLKFSPGATSTVVQVTDAAPAVDTSTSSTGLVITGKQITDLPLNGRNFLNLARLIPGVTGAAYGDSAGGSGGNTETFRNSSSGGAALSVDGLRPQTNNFILDGVDNNEALINTIEFFTPIDATEEFRVTISVAPAEFGRAGGAIIQSSIRSGTNAIHGSAFEFARNAIFDANPNYSFLGAGQAAALPFRGNQFGGSAELPILKGRLFIFGDYEGIRQNSPLNPALVTVPTQLMRNGDFSELLTARQSVNGAPTPLTSRPGTNSLDATQRSPNGEIYDPITGLPFPGNIIPTNRLNPAALNYPRAFPLPNAAGNANGLLQNYQAFQQDITNYNRFDTRVDLTLDTKNTLFARFAYDNSNFNRTSQFTNLPSGFGGGSNLTHARGYVVGYTRTITPNIVNELRVGYTRYTLGFNPLFSGVPLAANLGIVNIYTNPTEEHDRQSALDVTTGRVQLAGQNGAPRSLINTDKNNFAPRIGFAYDVYGNAKTVVRGGFGIFYYLERGGIDNQFGQQAPFGGSVAYRNQDGYRIELTGQAPQGTGYMGSLNNTTTTALLPAPGFPNFNPNNPPQGLDGLATNRNNQNSDMQQYNLQVEQQLDSATVLDVAYVGTKAEHIVTYFPYNFYQFGTGRQNLSNLGGVNLQLNSAVSHYNSLQVLLRRDLNRPSRNRGLYMVALPGQCRREPFLLQSQTFLRQLQPGSAARLFV